MRHAIKYVNNRTVLSIHTVFASAPNNRWISPFVSLNFYRPDALSDARPTVSKHWRHWWWCWSGVGVVICLERGADRLHMVQLMPQHPNIPSSLASFKSRLVLPFWYRLTQVVLEKRPLNGCSSSPFVLGRIMSQNANSGAIHTSRHLAIVRKKNPNQT